MDVGFYLGELLMQQGEVSVPGLGYFVQARVSGYYNEDERRFYPPYHVVQFDPQSIDDDALAEYIAAKKNISVSSAKYFAEKYITNLKQQAVIDEVPIGNLGWFYTELTQLTFRPADKLIDDTIFYGFEPIKINKASDIEEVEERPKVELVYPFRPSEPTPPVNEEPAEIAEPIVQTQQVESSNYTDDIPAEYFEENYDEEEEAPGSLRKWLIALTCAIILGVGVFALYRYKPLVFNKLLFWKHTTVVAPPVKPKVIIKPKIDTLKADSLKADSAKKDTVAKIGIVDSLKKGTFELIAFSSKNMVGIKPAIKKLKKMGFDAKPSIDAPGPRNKVMIGIYTTIAESEAVRRKLIKEGKITAKDSYTVQIIPEL